MRLREASKVALVCGAVLELVGAALVLRTYAGVGDAVREIAGVGTGPDTVGLIGTLLATEGMLLVLAGLFVLRPAPVSRTDADSGAGQPMKGTSP